MAGAPAAIRNAANIAVEKGGIIQHVIKKL
jgi:hypothetical protein